MSSLSPLPPKNPSCSVETTLTIGLDPASVMDEDIHNLYKEVNKYALVSSCALTLNVLVLCTCIRFSPLVSFKMYTPLISTQNAVLAEKPLLTMHP